MSTCAQVPFSRLPANVVPIHYEISLEPDLVNFTFTGTELVTVEIKESTSEIILNAAELEVSEAAFESAGGSKVLAKDITCNKDDERLIISFSQEQKPGRGKLHLTFKGILNDQMKGFYRAKYSADKYAATTHFEPTNARRAFPCWDEPAIRATFQVTLVAPKNLLTISNMPIVSQEPKDDNKMITKFDITPSMSTYLVAFIVGEFDHLESTSKGGVKLRAFLPLGKREQGRFALDVMGRSLDFYSEYFGIPYPLPKLDFALIPDFAIGAMENWGLITGREARFLYDEEKSSALIKEMGAIVNAHEVAHQWFGNLVTLEWWTHLWLKEGFATFMSYLCVQRILPEFESINRLVSDEFIPSLSLDSLKSSHPIEVPVSNPSQISEIFDNISYAKGASVLGMLHNYIGDDNFRKGLTIYLNRFKYKSAATSDLWTALDEASGKPVGRVMSTWTKQKGFPLITVSEKQDGDNRVLTLKQEKFSADGQLSPDEKDYLWEVPIAVTCESSPDKEVAEILLSSRSEEFVVPNVKPSEWIKLNPRFANLYRVKYPQSMLHALLPSIPSKKLPPLDRLNILSDVFALVSAGNLSTVDVLKVIESFKDEEEYVVWAALKTCLDTLSILMSETEFEELYLAWGRELMSTIKSKVSWEKKDSDPHTGSLLRGAVLELLASFDDPSVVEESKRRFDAFAKKTLVIPADVKKCVLNCVASHADDKVFETLVRLFRESDSPDEKNQLCSAIGFVRDTSLIERTIEFAFTEVRSQDLLRVFMSLSGTKLGRQAVWRSFQDKFDLIMQRYSGSAALCQFMMNCFPIFPSQEIADEMKSFFVKHPTGIDTTVNQVIESIQLKAAWLKRDSDAIKSYLTNA